MDNTDDHKPRQAPREDRQEASEASQAQAIADMQRQIAGLTAAVERHREQMRDYEKSLVERIADVDDDRRSTTTKLQRAWQTQGERIEGRLRRQARLAASALLLLGLLLVATLLLLYRQGEGERQRLANEVAEIRLQLDRTSRIGTLNDRAAGDPMQLSSAVGALSASLDGMRQEQERLIEQALDGERTARAEVDTHLAKEIEALDGERTARAEADTGLVKEIRRLEADQQLFARRLDSLDVQLQEAKAQAAAASSRSAPSTGDGAAAAPEPDQSEASVGTDAGAGEPKTGSDTGAPGADATTGAGETAPAPSATDRTVTADRRYALQMISFSGLQGLRRFAQREGLPPQVYYLAETYKGRPMYAVIHSLYPDYPTATAALSKLPAQLREMDPWVRPLPPGTKLRLIEAAPGD